MNRVSTKPGAVQSGKCVVIAFDTQLRNQFRLDEREVYIFDIEVSADNSSSVRRGYRLTTSPLGKSAERDSLGGFGVETPLPDWTFEVLDARWDEVKRSK